MASGGSLLPADSQRSDVEGGGARWDRVPLNNSPVARFDLSSGGNPGLPDERPTRRRCTATCFVTFGVLVVAIVLAIVVARAEYRSSGKGSGACGGQSSSTGSSTSAGTGSYPVNFFAIGDWGRQGGQNQSDVATLMGQVAQQRPPQFVLSTGDNMYPHGLSSPEDPLFNQSFTGVYTAQGLQVPWHAVLGNHDYCDSAHGKDIGLSSPIHQLNMSLANRDPRWHCERSYTESLAGGSVQIFFIDTSPFIEKYQGASWAKCPGGLLQQSWQAQLLELERRLSMSKAAWKLAVGHHPTYSDGEHGSNAEMIKYLEPLFARHGVQAYFAGHDHNLQHLTLGNYSMVVTGAGSKTQRHQSVESEASHYYYPYSGFVSVSVTPDQMEVEFYTLEGGEEPSHVSLIPRVPGLGEGQA